MTRTLYLFCSAAPPVFDVAGVIEHAQARGWDVCLGLTPSAARWVESSMDGLAALTGRPVRAWYRQPGEPDVWPDPDVVLFAPVTFNSLNAWALGLTSSFVAGVAAEAVGNGTPAVALPCVNGGLARHPQFPRSLETLRAAGVTVLHGADGAGALPAGEVPGEPFPWGRALDAVGTP